MATKDRDTAFFGHPVGLRTLFFTEMWERFSYYGMRAFLMLYMIGSIAVGGRGMTVTSAGLVMALFLSSVYLLSLPGGWIADRFVGQRAAVMIGGVGIAGGNALLALPADALFYPGLTLIALGTGLLKPNVSTIVGQLYDAKDIRRDSGYTIYYMGINVGAMIAPIVCGYFAQGESFQGFLSSHGIDPRWCWHFGFAASAVGMVAGLIQYGLSQRSLDEAGKHPHIPSDPARASRDRKVLTGIIGALGVVVVAFVLASLSDSVTVSATTITDIFGVGLAIGSIVLFYGLLSSARDASERRRVIAMIPLFVGSIAFFGIFEQASTTLSVFAEKLTDRQLLGVNIPASYYQSVNSIFIIALAPVFAWMWLRLARANKEPSSVMKFSIGMALVALSFVVMLPTLPSVMHGGTTSGGYLILLYFLYTCAELCISPVGLSSMSKLAPARLAGMVMGTWFLGAANGNYLAGRAAGFSEQRGFAFLFYFLIISALVVSAALFFVAPRIRRMMESEAASSEPDKPEKSEPEPLAKARVVKSGDA
ncbi:MAG TPA: oligopeptide:H+ symporter [Kofleriaceae bacterium]|nr:oligopeptide:H+ symporter [Kofleriaceae bacterium]